MAHDQEHEQGHAGPHQLLLEGCPRLWQSNLRQKRSERLDQVEKANCITSEALAVVQSLRQHVDHGITTYSHS